jgi:hypothetical protein
MNQPICDNVADSLRGNSDTRFPDLSNRPKPRWRDALLALASPAIRVHEYRNLHKAMFYDVMCELDCKDCR